MMNMTTIMTRRSSHPTLASPISVSFVGVVYTVVLIKAVYAFAI